MVNCRVDGAWCRCLICLSRNLSSRRYRWDHGVSQTKGYSTTMWMPRPDLIKADSPNDPLHSLANGRTQPTTVHLHVCNGQSLVVTRDDTRDQSLGDLLVFIYNMAIARATTPPVSAAAAFGNKVCAVLAALCDCDDVNCRGAYRFSTAHFSKRVTFKHRSSETSRNHVHIAHRR